MTIDESMMTVLKRHLRDFFGTCYPLQKKVDDMHEQAQKFGDEEGTSKIAAGLDEMATAVESVAELLGISLAEVTP